MANLPLTWLDKELLPGYSTIQSAGSGASQETTVDFVGDVTVTDDPINGRTVVELLGKDASAPIISIGPLLGLANIAQCALTVGASGTVKVHGSYFGASPGIGWSATDLYLKYGVGTPSTTAFHKTKTDAGTVAYDGADVLITGLTPGQTYQFALFLQPTGGSIAPVAGQGGIYVHQSAR